MAAVTAAVMSCAAAYYNATEQMRAMGLKVTKTVDSETLSLIEEMKRHRIKMEESYKETMRQAKIGTYILLSLVISIVACIADWTGVF